MCREKRYYNTVSYNGTKSIDNIITHLALNKKYISGLNDRKLLPILLHHDTFNHDKAIVPSRNGRDKTCGDPIQN